MPFKVGKYPGVAEKMRALADYASLGGIRQSYLDALKTMVERLENDPLQWGDPLYRAPHQSGIVCRACVGPITLLYSVHESVRVVLIIDLKPLFEWPIRL
jgi:hypothetical protein